VSFRGAFSFPNPVNETAARIVAAGAAVMAWSIVMFDVRWLVVPLAYGFVARVLAGPRMSPLGLFATRVAAPRLPARPVPGPPKRFAQGIGATLSVSALVALAAGHPGAGTLLVAAIAVAATLEAAFALCLGCRIFALLMRARLLPERVCEACGDLGLQRT
jgi:hypothetical protein